MADITDTIISVLVIIAGQIGFHTIIFYAFVSKVKDIVKKEMHVHDIEINIQNAKLNDLDKRVAIIEANQGHVANALIDFKKSIDDTFSKINDIWKYLIKEKQ